VPEYEIVTIVFTDMVGSTATLSRLSPSEADQLRSTHFARLGAAIADNNGEEVKNLGDGVMAAFASPSAALDAVVAMQQAIDAENRRAGDAVGLRVGVSTGEVTREGSDYFGEPVIEAARLCALADGGRILCSATVKATAGRRATQTFTSLGELELKGLPDPVATLEVHWEPIPTNPTGIALPARIAQPPDAGVVGRAFEAAQIRDAAKRAVEGARCQLVLVAGEPGIGKTTLAAEVGRALHDDGATVLYGRCDDGLAMPFQPFVEAFDYYAINAEDDLISQHIAPQQRLLVRLMPRWARARAQSHRSPAESPSVTEQDPETERYALFAAVSSFLASASRDAPIVLVVDDLHWADTATLLLLKHIVTVGEPMRVVIIATYRHSELSTTHPLTATLAALRREAAVHRVRLAGLEDSDVVALMEALAGHGIEGGAVELAHALRRETDGNPFFVNELLRHLAEVGAIRQDDVGHWEGSSGLDTTNLPDGVREVISYRVGRLGDAAQRILTAAAVIGRDFDVDLLAGVTERSEDEVLDVIEEGVAAALLTELTPDRFSFAHALVQHSLYEDTPAGRRRRLHLRIAETLEEMYGANPGDRIGEIARHWLEATRLVDATRAMSYARKAGESALERLAPEEAITWFSRAIEVADGHAGELELVGLQVDLGTSQRQAGDPAHRQTLIDAANAAHRLGATDLLVRSALANNRGVHSATGSVDDQRVAVLELALDAVGDDANADRARLLCLLALELTWTGDLDRRLALVDEAIDVARQVGDRHTLAWVLTMQFYATSSAHTLSRRRVFLAEALELAESTDDLFLQFWTCAYGGVSAFEAADRDEFERLNARSVALATRMSQPVLRWISTWADFVRTWMAGSLDEAEQVSNESYELGVEAGEPDALTIFGTQLILLRWAQGRMTEVEELVAGLLRDNPGLPGIRPALAHLYVEIDEHDKARALLRDAVASRFRDHPIDALWRGAIGDWAEVAVEVEDPEAAVLLYDLLEPWGDQFAFNGASTRGPVAHELGGLARVLGRLDDADRHLATALELCQRMRCPFFTARVHLSRVRLLRARNRPGDDAEAAALLSQVATESARHGFANLERRAAALR
jgi:class 3 adenylate cyclase/tetratricopeptide (TPR) repeat protein